MQAGRTELLVAMQNYFRVRTCGKAVPGPLQFSAQLHMVVDLAVENDPECAILVGDGLLAGRQIYNAQPGAANPDLRVHVQTKLIRPTMPDNRQHPAELSYIRRTPAAPIQTANNPAHRSSL